MKRNHMDPGPTKFLKKQVDDLKNENQAELEKQKNKEGEK